METQENKNKPKKHNEQHKKTKGTTGTQQKTTT